MRLNLHTLLINKNILKINALFIGCALWALFTSARHASRIITVPIGFYNTKQTQIITAPENITIELQGPCNVLRTLDTSTVTLHVDAHGLTSGMNKVAISARNLLLPQEINLVNCTYINCLVTVLGS